MFSGPQKILFSEGVDDEFLKKSLLLWKMEDGREKKGFYSKTYVYDIPYEHMLNIDYQDLPLIPSKTAYRER